jgi:hypothetical protein
MTFALPCGGKGQRSMQCLDCERPDPLTSQAVNGWIKGLLFGEPLNQQLPKKAGDLCRP